MDTIFMDPQYTVSSVLTIFASEIVGGNSVKKVYQEWRLRSLVSQLSVDYKTTIHTKSVWVDQWPVASAWQVDLYCRTAHRWPWSRSVGKLRTPSFPSSDVGSMRLSAVEHLTKITCILIKDPPYNWWFFVSLFGSPISGVSFASKLLPFPLYRSKMLTGTTFMHSTV